MKSNRFVRKGAGWAAMPLLLLTGILLASCSQDDLPNNPQGEPLPYGEYPLTLTASVDGVNTRSTGKTSWEDGDNIGVRIGADGATGCYMLNDNGTVKETVKPVYWQNTSSATVTAWYPCEAQTGINISDQKDGFAKFDFLTASAENQTYKNPVTLVFKHQMAKVEYTLTNGEGITIEELKGATVTLLGDATATFEDGVLATADQTDGEIISCYDGETLTGSALLVPQDMSGYKFIKVTLNLTEGQRDFYYVSQGDADLKSGYRYTYDIKVKRNGLVVSVTQSTSWDKGDDVVSTPDEDLDYRLYLSFGNGTFANLTVNDMAGDPISSIQEGIYPISEDGFVLSFLVEDVPATPYRREGQFGGYATISSEIENNLYTITFSEISSDVSFSVSIDSYEQAPPKVGDYYYADNTYSSGWYGFKGNCSGVIFKIGAGEDDKAENYDGKLKDNVIHGYVLASFPADRTRPSWCAKDYWNEFCGTNTSETAWCGYTNTQTIIAYAKQQHGLDYEDLSADNYTHIYHATHYAKSPAPDGTSGWYLGSVAQMYHITYLENDVQTKIKQSLDICGDSGTAKNSGERNVWRYWGTSTERDEQNETGTSYGIWDFEGAKRKAWKGYGQDPRPILTF